MDNTRANLPDILPYDYFDDDIAPLHVIDFTANTEPEAAAPPIQVNAIAQHEVLSSDDTKSEKKIHGFTGVFKRILEANGVSTDSDSDDEPKAKKPCRDSKVAKKTCASPKHKASETDGKNDEDEEVEEDIEEDKEMGLKELGDEDQETALKIIEKLQKKDEKIEKEH